MAAPHDLRTLVIPESQIVGQNGVTLGEPGRREVDGVWQLERQLLAPQTRGLHEDLPRDRDQVQGSG